MTFSRAAAAAPVPALSVVIPCFNEQDSLAELHRRLTAVCRDTVGADYEIVLVNDGSRDGTWGAMQALAGNDPRLVLVDLSRNHGHQLALSAGLTVCRGERILIIDADLQDPPELLPAMMARMDEGVDVVYGQRRSRDGETAFKTLTARAFYRLLRALSDVDIPLDTGDFRLMSRRVCDVLNDMPESHRFIRGMVSWVGFRQEPILYERAARFAGTTKYTLRKMVNFAADAITGFSIRPVRLAIYASLVFGVLTLLAALWAVGGWLAGATIPGWASLMVAVLLIGSVQMLLLGIVGEYVARSFLELKRRPLFIIREVRRGSTVETETTTADSPLSEAR